MAVSLVKKTKSLDALLSRIDKASGSLVTDVHMGCVSAAFHALVHGDPIYVNRLCEVSRRVAGNKVLRWFDIVANDVLTYNSKDKAFGVKSDEVRKLINPDEYEAFLLQAKNYLELSPDPTFKPFNTVSMLHAILNRFKNMKPEDKANPKNNFVGIDKIKALAKSLENARPATAKAVEAKAKPSIKGKAKAKKKDDTNGAPAAPAPVEQEYIDFGAPVPVLN